MMMLAVLVMAHSSRLGFSSAWGVAKELPDVPHYAACYVPRTALLFLWLIYTLNLRRNFIYKLLPKRQKLRLAAAAASVDWDLRHFGLCLCETKAPKFIVPRVADTGRQAASGRSCSNLLARRCSHNSNSGPQVAEWGVANRRKGDKHYNALLISVSFSLVLAKSGES